jgi:hypothetical protein
VTALAAFSKSEDVQQVFSKEQLLNKFKNVSGKRKYKIQYYRLFFRTY